MARGTHSPIVDRSTEHSYLVANEDVRGVGQPYMLQADFREASAPLDPNRVLGSVTSLSMAAIPSPIVGKYIQLPDGTVATPALSWTGDTDSGFYRTTAGEFNVSINAVKVAEFNSSGLQISSLTNGRVALCGADGQIIDDSGLLFDTLVHRLAVAGYIEVGTANDATQDGDFAAGLLGAARLFWDQPNQEFSLFDSSNNRDFKVDLAGDSWYNGSGDFGFGTTSPSKKVEITDGTQAQLRLSGTLGTAYADFRQQDAGTLLIENSGGITAFEQFPSTSGGDIEVWISSFDDAGGDSILKIRNYDDAAGDSFVQFKAGSGSSYWSFGEDNSDSDSCVLARGQALGTTNALRIDTNRFFLFTPGARSSGTDYGMQLTGPVHTGGTNGIFKVLGGASTGQTASTEIKLVDIDLSATVTWAAGAITNQRAFTIEAPTLAFASASTVTNAATLYIDRAPQAGTNATITNAYALWVDDGAVRIDSTLTLGSLTATRIPYAGTGGLLTDEAALTYNATSNTLFVENLGVNTSGPDRRLDILDASNPQLRLTHTDGTVYTDFQTSSAGNMTISASGTTVTLGNNFASVRFVNGVWGPGAGVDNTIDLGETSTPLRWRTLYLGTSVEIGAAAETHLISTAGVVLNEQQADLDVRIEGDNTTHLFFTDASVDRIGINQSAPACRFHLTESTIGNEVFRIESTATNDDPSDRFYHGRAATTDATVTTINTIAVAATTTVMIEAHVRARRTGGTSGTAEDAAGYIIAGTYKNVAGTATLVGAVSADYTAEDQAGWDATLTASGGNVLLRVTGAANNNVTWHSTVRVMQVSS